MPDINQAHLKHFPKKVICSTEKNDPCNNYTTVSPSVCRDVSSAYNAQKLKIYEKTNANNIFL